MRDRILKTAHGQYEMRKWDGRNLSGIKPLCNMVLVLVDKGMEKTTGGVLVPGTTAETQTLASSTGVIVAVGDNAFVWNMDRTMEWGGARPKPGDRVYFQRYGGQEYMGTDGEMYRLMEDRSIAGIGIDDDSEQPAAA